MRVLILNNPRSGAGDAGLFDYVHALGRTGAEVTLRYVTGLEPIDTMLGDARGFDRVVAAGGDGTVSGVSYALRDTGVPILAYPAGTANLVAMNLDLPGDPIALAELTLHGRLARVDVGELSCEPDAHGCFPASGGSLSSTGRAGFVMAAGAGFDARIMEGAKDMKSVIGIGAYVVAALQNLNPTTARFRLELDGRTVETEGIAVLVANFARIQFDLPMTSTSDAQDGMFEVVVLRTKTAAGLIPAVWAALLDRLGEHPARPASLQILTARAIRIVSEPSLPVQADGEVLPTGTPISARVLPGAATFVVPDETQLDTH